MQYGTHILHSKVHAWYISTVHIWHNTLHVLCNTVDVLHTTLHVLCNAILAHIHKYIILCNARIA
jgi:hypothetical protein